MFITIFIVWRIVI